jgi:hypothetical protein
VIVRKPGCLMEELFKECPALTWNQVFLEVDRLTRDGAVVLMRKGGGQYVVLPSRSGHADSSGTTTAP